MQANATTCNSTPDNRSSTKRQTHGARFTKVLDGRKQPIRGLWQRNERFYAQLTFEDANTGGKVTRRVCLTDKDGAPVKTAAEAKTALEKLRTQRSEDTLPVLRRTPKFSDFAKTYIAFIRSGTTEKLKEDATIDKEESALERWGEQIGSLRLDQIKRRHVNAFIAKRKQDGMSNRTVNLDVIALNNALNHAIQEGHIGRLPTENMGQLTVPQKQRALFTPADLEKLCAAAFQTKKNKRGQDAPLTKNAQEFVDYLRFLAYTGARRNEALRCRWDDVSFEREQVTIAPEGKAKNKTPRTVDFNAKLKAHLLDMQERRKGVSDWLFPSPQRGAKDVPAKSFHESLKLARAAAGIPKFGFHDLRHLFISFCVMSGIDYMTIARWVGHKDGGVLIGKVYGHLANEHSKAQAKKLSFEPQIVKEVAA